MPRSERRMPPKRRYPAFYERAVPIALAIIVAFVVILLVIIAAVFLGLVARTA